MNAPANFDLSAFLDRMRRDWLSYAYFRTRCHDDSEDLIQQASEQFVQYYRKASIPPDCEEPYFVVILKRLIYRLYNRRKRQEIPIEPANMEFAGFHKEDHAERLEMERIRAIIDRVMAGSELKERTRQAFGLVRLLGLSYSQAGKRLGCEKSTVCRNIEKADSFLRSAFQR